MHQNGNVSTTKEKSGSLKYSASCVWNGADVLGRGATACVYLGRNKVSGEVVAVKHFANVTSQTVAQARHREIELLRSLNHNNVIKLFSCETEVTTGSHVLIMEYYSGGSLYSILDQPENAYGFQEKEFLLVLDHITSGLQYLRSKDVIHRDIKPGNILRGVQQDGTSLYVLTDFGAARELMEDETFMSIYGTEEYLHPGMFRRAVLKQTGQDRFTSSIDLWSLGVTLYHVATGHLPFKPYGGRSDAHTMFQITSGKESGIISGIQKTQNGQIQWSRDLPNTCRLSKCLKAQLVVMFAGLLETNGARMITFDQFFGSVRLIIDAIQIRVFVANSCETDTLYMNRTDRYSKLQERITLTTGVRTNNQILLVSEKLLSDVIDETRPLDHCPFIKDFVFVFDKEKAVATIQRPLDIPTIPAFANDWTVPSDASLSKKCASFAFYLERETEVILKKQELLATGIKYLGNFIIAKLRPVDLLLKPVDTAMTGTSKRLDTLLQSQHFIKQTISLVRLLGESSVTDIEWDYVESNGASLNDVIKKAEKRLSEIKVYLDVLQQRLRELSTDAIETCLGCQDDDKCLSTMQHIRQTAMTTMNTFLKHKRYGDLHSHEMFIHQVERQKLEDTIVRALSLVQCHCHKNLGEVIKAVVKQSDLLMKHYTRSEKVETNMTCVVNCQDQINTRMDKIDQGFKNACSTLNVTLERLLNTSRLPGVQSVLSGVQSSTEPESRTSNLVRIPPNGAASIITTVNPATEEKRNVMSLLSSEMKALQTETLQLDTMMKSNVESIKRFLQDSSTLSASSINHEMHNGTS